MPSCTCLRNPGRYVTEPKKGSELDSDVSNNTVEVQSLVTDPDTFDHEALLRHEGSTTYDDESSSSYGDSSSSSSDDSSSDEGNEESQSQVNYDYEYNDEAEEADLDKSQSLSKQNVMETIQKWNELLELYDNDPDVIEFKKSLNLPTGLSDDQLTDETKKQVDELIRKLTSSLSELRSSSNSQDSEKELVLEPYEGDDDDTHFRCFVRRLRQQTGNAEDNTGAYENVAQDLEALINALGSSNKNLLPLRSGFLSRMSSSIKTSSVFKNLLDPLDLTKSSMDRHSYLHMLSEKVDNEDLASVSTLSDLDTGNSVHPFTDCLFNARNVMDEMLCTHVRRHARDVPEFCARELRNQVSLRKRYGDSNEFPPFLI